MHNTRKMNRDKGGFTHLKEEPESELTPMGEKAMDSQENKSIFERPFKFKKVVQTIINKEVNHDSTSMSCMGEVSPLLQIVFEKEKKQIKHVSKKVDILDYLLDSSNFDIDLLQSFSENKIYSSHVDPSGQLFYKQLCDRAKLPPVDYIREHLKDRNFVMQQHYLSKDKLLLFIEALKQNTTIYTLDLADNNICSESAVSLVEMLKKNSKIFSLNLSHNNIQMEGVSALSTLLDVTPTLISLFVARNALENEDITPLVQTLKANFFLTTLDLSYNKISSEGGHYLGSCLAMNETLHILDLHWCQINGKGAVELAKGLRLNLSLKVLDISWNGFAEDSCCSLALSLMVNTSLKILDLTKNRLTSRAGSLLAGGLKNNQALEILILDNNSIGDDGVKAILQIMPNHPTLQLLSFQGVHISDKIYQQIIDMPHIPKKTVLQNDAIDIQSHLEKLCFVYLSWLDKFVLEHKTALKNIFEKFDYFENEHLGKEQMRFCLEKTGFYLPLRHMAVLLGKLKKNDKNLIAYRPLFDDSISKMIKTEELKRKFNIGPNRSYYRAKSAWN